VIYDVVRFFFSRQQAKILADAIIQYRVEVLEEMKMIRCCSKSDKKKYKERHSHNVFMLRNLKKTRAAIVNLQDYVDKNPKKRKATPHRQYLTNFIVSLLGCASSDELTQTYLSIFDLEKKKRVRFSDKDKKEPTPTPTPTKSQDSCLSHNKSLALLYPGTVVLDGGTIEDGCFMTNTWYRFQTQETKTRQGGFVLCSIFDVLGAVDFDSLYDRQFTPDSYRVKHHSPFENPLWPVCFFFCFLLFFAFLFCFFHQILSPVSGYPLEEKQAVSDWITTENRIENHLEPLIIHGGAIEDQDANFIHELSQFHSHQVWTIFFFVVVLVLLIRLVLILLSSELPVNRMSMIWNICWVLFWRISRFEV